MEVGSAWEKRGFYAVPTGVNGGSELLIFVLRAAHCYNLLSHSSLVATPSHSLMSLLDNRTTSRGRQA